MNIFITGGTTGMGLSVGKIYQDKGWNVGVCSFQPPEEVVDSLPSGFKYYQADVTDENALKEAIQEFAGSFGSLDIVFANAGISMPKKKLPDFDLGRRVININLLGTLNAFAPAIEIMQKQKSGHLVGIGSISGLTGMPGMACYGASKSAVMSLCETLACDLSHFGIDVTCVAPGFVKTPLTEKNPHKMPFMMEQEEAAQRIVKAIEKKRALDIFPLPMKFVGKGLYYLPKRLYNVLMKKDLLGLSKHSG